MHEGSGSLKGERRMTDWTAVILAAGKGTRMKSVLPKVLHRVGGQSMVVQVLRAAKKAGAKRQIVILGFGADTVKEAIQDQAEICLQTEQLGTGHAVLQTEKLLQGALGTVMVLCGDTPLLKAETLQGLLRAHEESGAKATALTAILEDATGYGRVIRAEDGSLLRIVEDKDATESERQIREVNAGIYCFALPDLFTALHQVKSDNAQGEYYLPDVLGILRQQGKKIWAYAAPDFQETLGVNSRAQLAEAEAILRRRKNEELMAAGVSILDPQSTFVDMDVTIGADTVLYPFTWLQGNTHIGSHCIIGPNSRLRDAEVGDKVAFAFSDGEQCRIDDGATLGPFAHLRPDTHLLPHVKVGNFVEVKNSTIGEGTKLPHLSYIGDCDMGADVNMGCGTITVNYDGKQKFRTKVGNHAFVGCNSNLVAPVSVGDGAYIAAGSTITKDVPPKDLAVARGRQRNISGWKDKREN